MKQKHIYQTAFLVMFCAGLLTGCTPGTLQDVDDYSGVRVYNLGQMVNSAHDDFGPFLQGNRLMFTSNRPTKEGYIQGDDFWFADREGNQWSRALNLGGSINTDNDEGSPYLTNDGYTVYFVQCWTEDGLGDGDLYSATFDASQQWQSIQNLGKTVNSSEWDSHPYISPDGKSLYFASNRSGGYGGTDIWVSTRRRSGKWGKPKNLGPQVNTSGHEKSPMIAPNGSLYFASNGHRGLGGFDVYVSEKTRKKWKTAKNIGRPFNSREDDIFFRLSSMEDTVFISSNREGGEGGYDIYAMAPNPFKDTTRYQFYLAGMVYDTTTEMGIRSAQISVKQQGGAPWTRTTERTGTYRFRTELGQSIEITAKAKHYHEKTIRFTVPEAMEWTVFRKSIALKPIAVKDTLKPDLASAGTIVYFEFDKSRLTKRASGELERYFESDLRKLVELKGDFEIQLDSHTDDYGTEIYNINLSRRRGATVSKYLQRKGIRLASILVNAYGEKRPVESNESDEGRSQNRRVEVRLVIPD